MKLGDIIRKYREEHYLSQREFARKCQLSNAQISLLEKGVGARGEPFMPSGRTISKVAKGMGLSSEALIAQVVDIYFEPTKVLAERMSMLDGKQDIGKQDIE